MGALATVEFPPLRVVKVVGYDHSVNYYGFAKAEQ